MNAMNWNVWVWVGEEWFKLAEYPTQRWAFDAANVLCERYDDVRVLPVGMNPSDVHETYNSGSDLEFAD